MSSLPEPTASEPRTRRRRALLVGVLALLVLAAVAGDWWLRVREMDKLLDATERSESSMAADHEELRDFFTRWSARPNPTPDELPGVGEQIRQELRELLAEGEEDLLVADAEVSDVFVMPWHRSLRNAQADYREHVRAWADYYHESAEDPSALAEPAPPSISASFRVAGTSFRAAVPTFDPLGDAERVDELFPANAEN